MITRIFAAAWQNLVSRVRQPMFVIVLLGLMLTFLYALYRGASVIDVLLGPVLAIMFIVAVAMLNNDDNDDDDDDDDDTQHPIPGWDAPEMVHA